MVTSIPRLTSADKRELLWLLNPRRYRPDMDDAAVDGAIAQHLRRVLGLSDQIDLPQGFRRRMIEVGREFGLAQNATEYDLTSDEDIGRDLVAEVLTQVRALADERKSEVPDFASSFRTMNREARAEWLHRAALAASNTRRGHPDEQQARKAEDAQASHEDTARQLLEDVAQATAFMMAADAAADAAAAAARFAAPRSTRATTSLSLAAGPIGVLAGGAFLYELRRRRKKSAKSQSQPDVRGDRRKERLSPMVQAVVTVCAFVVAHLPTEEPD